ncbi:hypothetical protein DPMN_174264 [Dreissena polymorpha]|uniref:Uncharacterized protein n=1 Tax=Dreissena polymorpha TaxID=45954 RepID=A0A9D4E339_DREPO|nr:hypothetical protein DPMN_174264 [Dreissena polymorpha]
MGPTEITQRAAAVGHNEANSGQYNTTNCLKGVSLDKRDTSTFYGTSLSLLQRQDKWIGLQQTEVDCEEFFMDLYMTQSSANRQTLDFTDFTDEELIPGVRQKLQGPWWKSPHLQHLLTTVTKKSFNPRQQSTVMYNIEGFAKIHDGNIHLVSRHGRS